MFFYEVNLKYPEDLRMKTKYFSFCPENIKPEKLSKYQETYKEKNYTPTKILMLNQNDKEKYIIEGKMLDWYLDHGIILTKVHKKLNRNG